MKRPDIKDTLIGMELKQVHDEYQKSPLLFMHINILDKYIDYLEKQNEWISVKDELPKHLESIEFTNKIKFQYIGTFNAAGDLNQFLCMGGVIPEVTHWKKKTNRPIF